MERLTWNEVLDLYLWKDKMFMADWEDMNDMQKAIIDEIKKSKKRQKKFVEKTY